MTLEQAQTFQFNPFDVTKVCFDYHAKTLKYCRYQPAKRIFDLSNDIYNVYEM